MAEKQITYKFTDTGHWLARCDHSTNVIELNRKEFFKLSHLMRDYIWVHEYVHLLYDVYDEVECNRITDEIFISRASDEEDRKKRMKMVENSNHPQKSTAVLTTLACTAISLITGSISQAVINSKVGYYSMSEEERRNFVAG